MNAGAGTDWYPREGYWQWNSRSYPGLGMPSGCIPVLLGNFRKLRQDVFGAEGDVAAAAGLESCQVRLK